MTDKENSLVVQFHDPERTHHYRWVFARRSSFQKPKAAQPSDGPRSEIVKRYSSKKKPRIDTEQAVDYWKCRLAWYSCG